MDNSINKDSGVMILNCLIEGTGNNLFVTILDINKKMLLRCSIGLISIGSVRLTGTKKKTIFGAEQVGRFVGKRLRRLGYDKINIILGGNWLKGERGCIRGLLRSGIVIVSLRYYLHKAHNGVRYRKMRRR